MKKTVYSSLGKLKCVSCGNYHYEWWMISHQKKLSKKTGCASIMRYNSTENHYEIISYYGSGYDTNSFKVLRTLFPKTKVYAIDKLIQQVNKGIEPIICDKCVKRFLDREYIIFIHSYFA